MTDKTKRAVKAVSAAVACAGVIMVLLSLCLLVFGSKTEGRLVGKKNVRGDKYRLSYVYTVDGGDYPYETVRTIYREENAAQFDTQKISYPSFAPSLAYTEGMSGAGMLAAIVGGCGFLFAAYDPKKTKPAPKRKSPQWNSYINRVKSGDNKQE